MPSDIISVAIAVLVIIVWIFLLRLFVYPRFSRRRAENLQLARLVYSGVLAVALVFIAEMLTLSGPLEDTFILTSALCFAVSVPCLATMVLLITGRLSTARRSGSSILDKQWPSVVHRLGTTQAVRRLGGRAS